jgi:hypothetical protein
MTNNLEQKLRRELAAEGFRLWKVREDSRHFPEYGPYAVVDESTNMVMASGANLDQMQSWFNG